MTIIKLALLTELLCDVCSFVINLYYLIKFLNCSKKGKKKFASFQHVWLGNHSSMHSDAMYIYMGLLIHKYHELDIEVHGHQCNIHIAICSETQLHLALVGPVWKLRERSIISQSENFFHLSLLQWHMMVSKETTLAFETIRLKLQL